MEISRKRENLERSQRNSRAAKHNHRNAELTTGLRRGGFQQADTSVGGLEHRTIEIIQEEGRKGGRKSEQGLGGL